MEFAYKPALWRDLFEMVALAAVTLTGFLSVGLSINSRTGHRTPRWRPLAAAYHSDLPGVVDVQCLEPRDRCGDEASPPA